MPHLSIRRYPDYFKITPIIDRILIGRDDKNDIVLGDPEISRFHASIKKNPDGNYLIIDNDSKNGVYINDKRISQSFLDDNSIFKILDYTFTFVEETFKNKESSSKKVTDETTVFVCNKKKTVNDNLKKRLAEDGIIIESHKMIELYSDVMEYAIMDIPVLIIGETGTGKELVARSLHKFSGRNGEYITLNCTAINDTIFESEFFGTVKGAFTGAVNRDGILARSNNGTIFLDEIGDMSPYIQPKFLRFLEDMKITRVGDTAINRVDARIIAGTHQNLKKMILEKKFRNDLYQRLAYLELNIPPLRNRKEEIFPIAMHFFEQYSLKYKWKIPHISDSAMKIFMEYDWPGNVRELVRIAMRLFLRVKGETIFPDDLFKVSKDLCSVSHSQNNSVKTKQLIFDEEKDNIINALKQTKGNKKRASELLGIGRATLYKKIKKHNISTIEKN